MAIGKISGPLLKENLLRDGIDLAFETDLLYFDVNNRRIGVKTSAPTHDLTVNGTTRTTNLEVTTTANIADITISGNQIYSNTNVLTLSPAVGAHVVYQNKLIVDNIKLEGNQIAAVASNTDLEFITSGTGQINLNADTQVFGNLHATGTITADGNLTLGDADTDSIDFKADIASNIIPNAANTYSLGTAGKQWNDVWVQNLNASSVTAGNFEIDGIDITLRPGNTYYVSVNGDDGNTGTHQNDPLSSVGRALDLATAGDTVYIYPGVYSEALPLTVPVGVVVKGAGIRSVTIQPDSDVTVDVFLLNGETTVEDLTITGFEYDAGTNTGYAFRFANNMTVTSRSPYIRNISVITAGSTVRLLTNPASDPRGFLAGDAGKGAYIDGSIVNAASREASMLFDSATFITPGVDAITTTDGARVEWLNSFSYFANRGIYSLSGSTGFAGAGQTRLRIDTRIGSWNVGNTVRYYDTDGTTILASGVIDSIDGNYINLTGKCLGFETITDRTPTTLYAQGGAALSTAEKKWGTSSLLLDGIGDYVTHPTAPDFAFPSTALRLAKTITASGNAVVSTAQSKFGGASVAFDGTGDYLSVASNTDFAFGTGDFTIECWVRLTSLTGTQIIFDFRNDGTAPSSYAPTVTLSSGTLVYQTIAGNRIVGTLLTINTWYHVAVARSGTATKLFLNGTQVGSTYTDTNTYIQGQLTIGAQYNNSFSVNGYIDEVRVSNTARYTTTFTPSTTAFTADSASKLLIHGDSTIVDDNGTSTDFTLEAWIYPTVTTYHSIFDFRSVSTEEAIYLGINLSDQVYLYVNGAVPITTAAISLNVWTHVAVVRSSGTTKIYINGTQSGSSWADITNYGTTKPLRIGAWYNALYGFTGYIDDVRISKGVARYTTAFTAPTEQLTGDLDTVLLLHFDGLNGSTIFLDNGITLQDIRNITTGGTASIINFADYSDFGAEIRSISSANVYGNYGVYADGVGNDIVLLGHNFSYVGTGRLSNNDPTDAVQNNEVTALNGAHVHYDSIDQIGNFRVGDYFEVEQSTGNITFSATNIEIASPDGVTFTDGINVTTVDPTKIETGNIRISGNTIESTTGGLIVTASNNEITATSNVNVSGTLTVTDNITVSGNTTIGDNSSDLLTVNAQINTSVIPSSAATYDLGTASLPWRNVYTAQTTIDSITITGNRITTNVSNTDLELAANGTGVVSVPNDNLVVDQNLTVLSGTSTLNSVAVTGTLTVNNLITNSQVTAATFSTGDIQISGNVITTTLSNSNLELRSNGTGAVTAENLSFNGSTITGLNPSENITITPSATGIVNISSTQALKVPVGTDLQRPLTPQSGMIRFNSTTNRYEGYTGTQWIQLGGVSDVDGNTYIVPEVTPGSNENTLYFYANGSLAATLNNSYFDVNKVVVDQIEIDGNQIRTTNTNTDLNLLPNGTGAVAFDNLKFGNSTITNTVSGAITEFKSTGTGYYRIVGNNAFVIPAGISSERPGTPITGMMRYNIELGLVEVYDGLVWGSVAGSGAGITSATANEIAAVSALIFG